GKKQCRTASGRSGTAPPHSRWGTTSSRLSWKCWSTKRENSSHLDEAMKPYPISLENAGTTAMWTRPDTGDAPVSYPAPTFQAAKQIFESILWLRSAEVMPTRVEICRPLVFHRYFTSYGGPLREGGGKGDDSHQLIATVLINVH